MNAENGSIGTTESIADKWANCDPPMHRRAHDAALLFNAPVTCQAVGKARFGLPQVTQNKNPRTIRDSNCLELFFFFPGGVFNFGG